MLREHLETGRRLETVAVNRNAPAAATRSRERDETVSLAEREELLELYGRGLYLQAWEASKAYGPLEEWRGTESRVLAARLLHNLGGPRRSNAWILRAFRADPRSPTACYFGHRALFYSRGPLEAWRSMQCASSVVEGFDDDQRADWYAFEATVLSCLRDFEPAEQSMARALEAAPDRSWVHVERSGLLARQDRHGEALQALRRALELRPWYRPAVQSLAHDLVQQNRIDEALALLAEACERLESCHVIAQRAQLLVELGRYEEAREVWARYEDHAPLLEEKGKRWLRANLADVHYLCGDLEAAIEWSEGAGGWHQQVARNTAYCPDGRRTLLEVGFVLQHHRTCGPASLSMLCDYWDMPVDQLELAAEICYDGTTNLSERRWAEGHGWVVREFTLNWRDAVALVDRGVPFALCTTEPTSAHLQIVMGYDERRETFLVRDPGQRLHQEFLADRTLARYRSTGPRCMVLVPSAEAERLSGLKLLDEELYDLVYRLEGALADHRREEAEEAFAELARAAPGHRIVLTAERNLSLYDMDTARTLAATDALLERYPEDGIFELRKLGLLERLGRREELLALLQDAAAREGADPAFRERLACELLADARRHGEARTLLRRAMHRRPVAAVNLHTLADLLGSQRRFAEALPLYRFAACLEHKHERYSRSYFCAARYAGRVEEGLDFLRDRVERYGEQSSQPLQTLVWAYDALDRAEDARKAIERGLELRPDDGELLLFVAEEFGRRGELSRARELLGRAEGRVARIAWLRTAALVARLEAQPREAIERWREVVHADPLSVEAHAELAGLLAETEGRAAAVEHLLEVQRQQPHNQVLLKQLLGWFREGDEERREAVVRQMIANNPRDPWAWRELAVVLGDRRRFAEAHEALDEALRLDPHSCAAYGILGDLHRKAGELEEARAAFQQALLLDIDYPFAIERLVRCCERPEHRQEALAFLGEELGRQRVYGAALLAIYEEFRGAGDPEEVLVLLRAGREAFPELWQSWSALVGQLGDMGRLDDALEVAEESLRRFPFKSQVRRDLAWVHRLRGDDEAEVATLERLLVVDPAERSTVRVLAGAHLRRGRFAEARALLEPEVARAPFDANLRNLLAQVRWEVGDREAALEEQEQALRIDPHGPGGGWARLEGWATALGVPERPLALARELCAARPRDAQAWLRVARMTPRGREDDCLAALDRALEIDPHLAEAYDERAERLASAGDHEEALAACEPPAFSEGPPLILRGRRAWVLAQRGDRREAIAAMRSVLEGTPTYYWGWLRLSDWCRAEGDDEGHLEAARGLVRLAPHDDLALSHLGSALLRTGDERGARQAFARALEHAPTAFFAGTRLADMLCAEGDFDESERILVRLAEAYPRDEDVWERVVSLEAARGRRKEALSALARLARALSEDGRPLERAAERLCKRGWSRGVARVLNEALGDPEACPRVGRVWIGVEDRLGRLLGCGEVVGSLHGSLGRQAEVAYLERLAESDRADRADRVEALERHVRERAAELRSVPELWGTVGYAYNFLGLSARTREWLADWREREDARPWMLTNLALAYLEHGDVHGAREVLEGALALPPDHTTHLHSVLLGFERALDGEVDAAAELLRAGDGQELGRFYGFVHLLGKSLLAGDPAAARQGFAPARELYPGFAGDRSAAFAHRRAAWRCAAGPLGVLWFLWEWLAAKWQR